MICENILDERDAQPEYMKLVKALRDDAYPEEAEAVEKLIVADEKKHEEYLKVLNASHDCKCLGVVVIPK
jgi:hypothetical protein